MADGRAANMGRPRTRRVRKPGYSGRYLGAPL